MSEDYSPHMNNHLIPVASLPRKERDMGNYDLDGAKGPFSSTSPSRDHSTYTNYNAVPSLDRSIGPDIFRCTFSPPRELLFAPLISSSLVSKSFAECMIIFFEDQVRTAPLLKPLTAALSSSRLLPQQRKRRLKKIPSTASWCSFAISIQNPIPVSSLLIRTKMPALKAIQSLKVVSKMIILLTQRCRI